MTPRERPAKLEHEGHQLTPAEVREMERIIADTARRKFGEMMRAPAYQWRSQRRAGRYGIIPHVTYAY
jgi:hypothetical protein